jgi:tRNA threonylcarbamoyladenosine modification (KEOPS) complex  Pcc1 subunit
MAAHPATCTIELEGAASPDVIAGALAPEAGSGVPGTEAEVSAAGGTVQIKLKARDISSLRAAVNSYLRWASLAGQAESVSRKGE